MFSKKQKDRNKKLLFFRIELNKTKDIRQPKKGASMGSTPTLLWRTCQGKKHNKSEDIIPAFFPYIWVVILKINATVTVPITAEGMRAISSGEENILFAKNTKQINKGLIYP